jgi:3-oxoacyl-[acyl-carrier-protein] synthase II
MREYKRRIVVTGLGLVSPVGNCVESAWQNIIAGKSGIDTISKFDHTTFPVHFAGEVKNFNIEDYIPAKEARHMDIFIHYGIAAGIQAIKDAGIDINQTLFNPERIGIMIGSGIGGLPVIEHNKEEFLNKGARRISPFLIPAAIINMISGHLSIMYGFSGPNLAIVTACTTGLHCIGEASRMIEYGDADVMIAGGAESTICHLGIGGFANMRALSTRNDNPSAASRPWDKDRDGFVLGEGAGVLVLEELEHAKKRGAKIYCEIIGYGRSADAYHMTAPTEDGSGAAHCMKLAMNNAEINPEQIDYVNAHGTSTPLGDIAETKALCKLLGDHANNVVVSSTKSMTGHLLGGSGGLESVFSALALYHQIIPPTINLDNPDPACHLDYCAHTARASKIDVLLKNSFGFGGTNGTLVMQKV